MSEMLHARLDHLVSAYGEDAVGELLDAASLMLTARNPGAIRRAVTALVEGEDGTLVFRVSGLPGDPPRVAWVGAGFAIVAESRPVDV